jgi:hypothetical protein
MADHRGLYDGGVTGDAFYEWLLSDHPDARAERERRCAAYHQHQGRTRWPSAPGSAR